MASILSLSVVHGKTTLIEGIKEMIGLQDARKIVFQGALFVGLWFYGFWTNVMRGVNLADESWFLQVVYRSSTGETLYRDIFLGVTPVSVYMTEVLVKLFGSHVLIIKGLVALCFAMIVMICLKMARRLDFSVSLQVVLVLGLAVWAAPFARAVYQPLASLFFAAGCSIALSWRHGSGVARGSFIVGGVTAGLCIMTKQNIGVFLLLVLIAAAWEPRCKFYPRAFWILASCTSVVVGLVIPILMGGGMPQLWDYGFLNKTVYLDKAYVSFVEGFRLSFGFIEHGFVAGARETIVHFPFLLVPCTMAFLVYVWIRIQAPMAGLLLLFVGMSLAGAYPRFNLVHVTDAVPLTLLATLYSIRCLCSHVSSKLCKYGERLVVVVLVVTIVSQGTAKILKAHDGSIDKLDVPHFTGVFFKNSDRQIIPSRLDALKRYDTMEVFILSPHAGFYYLSSGLRNPTAYDYPYVTAFGTSGEESVIRKIECGDFKIVAVGDMEYTQSENLYPERLLQYVRNKMQLCGERAGWRFFKSSR
jgi:hypothetical protein